MIGIDIVKIDRIGSMIEKYGIRFLHRVFSDLEILESQNKNKVRDNFLAKRFAAKEAYIKATGREFIVMRQIETQNLDNGQPILFVKGERARNIFLSLSDDGDYAIACVMFCTTNACK